MSSGTPWRQAWEQALYGPGGFYRRERPADHFRTAAHAAPELVAEALIALVDRHRLTRIVEIGCGAGELLTEVHRKRPSMTLLGVEVRPRPGALPTGIGWSPSVPHLDDQPTLLLGWELLDVLPITIAEQGRDRVLRHVLVDEAGDESLGPPITAADAHWCRRWNPATGERVEIGRARDEFWSTLVAQLPRGVAVAVDYGRDGPLETPTLTGFRGGREVRPVPDGTCDLTSHVRWDSLRAALAGPHRHTRLLSQRKAFQELGIGAAPADHSTASTSPADYLAQLARRGRLAELTDPHGLGAFGWLVTEVAAGA